MFSKLEVLLLCPKEEKLVYPILDVAGRLAKLCARFETRQEHATFSLYLNRTATLSRIELCTKWKCYGTDLADLSRCSFRDLRVAHFLSGKSPMQDQYGEQRCAPDQLTSNLCQAYCCRGELDQVGQPT